MAIPNVNAITSDLRMMSDQQLQQYAAMHKNDPYILPMAVSESNARKQMRMQAQGAQGMQPQPKVADADIAAMLPEEQGIGALPTPNMRHMADGGIAGYGDGGELNYTGGNSGPLMGMSGGGEPVTRMAGGGVARFQVGGDVQSRYKQESMEMGMGTRMQYSPEVQAFAQAQEEASKAGYAERERQRMLQGPYGPAIAAPSPEQAATKPAGAMPSARDDNFRRQTDPRLLGVSATPPAVAAPKADTNRQTGMGDAAAPRVSAAPAAPEQSAAARYAAMQKEMGLGDTKNLDAERADYAASLRKTAADERAAFERDMAERGKYGEAKEARLKTREEGLGKEKDQMSGLALIEAGLGIMSTPGNLATAIGKGAKEGLKSYGEGLAKLKLAQEKIDDSRDSIEEFRRNEANMTAAEKRKYESQQNRTESEIKKLAMDAAKEMYGYKREDVKTLFNAGTQEKLTGMEIQGRKDVAAMQERGANARATLPSGEMRTAMMLGTGTTDAARLESGMKKLQEITADKSGMAAVKLLTETNAKLKAAGDPPITMADLLQDSRAFSAFMYPKVSDTAPTRDRPR